MTATAAWGNKSEENSALGRKTAGIRHTPLSNNPECKLLTLLLKYGDQVIGLKCIQIVSIILKHFTLCICVHEFWS